MKRKSNAVKKVIMTLRIILAPALLFVVPGTLMDVQAACEAPAQPEGVVEEVPPEAAPEAVLQEQATPPEETAPAQAEVTTEEPPAQTADMTEALPSQPEIAAEETAAQPEAIQEAAPAQPLSVTMVGDSVMLGGSSSILEKMPDFVIDAKVSRQFTAADSVLNSLEQQGLLRQTVVIGLGTNGAFSLAKGQELINRLGSERTIYWVTVYGRELSWQEEANATIRQLAETNENVHIIDWTQAASQNAEWICADGIHLSAAGREGYAQTVLEGLL